MTDTTKKKAERAKAIETLRRILEPGETVYCVLRNVSKSGMQRRIDLYAIGQDREPFFLSGLAACALGTRWDRDRGGVVVRGCGMDMGFHLVSCLSRCLYPDGASVKGEHRTPDYVLPSRWL